MSVYIFTGPTLSPEQARRELEAIYLPPVEQGDVYRVALRRPRAIGIVDGYFERVPAVWHKEILWAMSQGIHVFGSSSMGALRAAELAAFGMEGVGAIFAAYRDGELEDDDEVAVIHGPAESGYREMSVALVNIRRTLAAAEAQPLIEPPTRLALEKLAKRRFYAERTYARLLQDAAEQGLPGAELAALRDWLPRGQIDQKRDDALAMLRTIRERLEAGLPPKQVAFHFEHTEFWDQAQRSAGEQNAGDAESPTLLNDPLLDELRLDPDSYQRACQATLSMALARAVAQRYGQAVSGETLRAVVGEFQREHDLLHPAAADEWLNTRGLSADRLARLLEEEEVLRWAERWIAPHPTHRLPDYLRLTGAHAALERRALDKQRALEAHGLADPSLADAGISAGELMDWYFVGRIARAVPADLDSYARAAGFANQHVLLRAVLREFCYTTLAERHTESN